MKRELRDYILLKEKVEEAQSKADKAEGALNEVLKTIKKEFGCKSLKEAKVKLKKLKKEEAKAEEEFDKAMTEFEEKWGELLEDDNFED